MVSRIRRGDADAFPAARLKDASRDAGRDGFAAEPRTPPASPECHSAARCLVAGILIVLALAIYGRVRDYPFLLFDDFLCVTENPRVRAGISPGGVAWAFASAHAGNWHP